MGIAIIGIVFQSNEDSVQKELSSIQLENIYALSISESIEQGGVKYEVHHYKIFDNYGYPTGLCEAICDESDNGRYSTCHQHLAAKCCYMMSE